MAQSAREIHWSANLADTHQSRLDHVQDRELRHVSIRSFREGLYRLRLGLRRPRLRVARCSDSPTHVLTRTETLAFLRVHLRPRPLVAPVDHQGHFA